MSAPIDPGMRKTFIGIADVLIPAHGPLPAASGADVGGAQLDRILELREDLMEAFSRGLRAAAGKDPATAARNMNQEDPKALATIGLVAIAAYYMHPKVRELIGYPGQERRPIDPDAPPDYMQDDLLKPVIDRGPIFRPTPR